MIEITDKKDCTGCNACTQRCPVGCISMQTDEEGFLYPIADKDTCIDCGLCERVCPVINPYEPRLPIETLAAKNPDRQVRMASSSGGVFHALAKSVIEEGGVVFGARFNSQWDVEHAYTETMDGIKAFQGSKYVQSTIGGAFTEAERFLKAGRKVLFTGTPCQIAGLKHFLRKDYAPQLITADVACHGVPSPTIWRDYLNFITPDSTHITSISFRSKKISWEDYGMSISFTDHRPYFQKKWKDSYMFAFLRNLTLRPSCHRCPAKCGKSHSDITLGDLWGINHLLPNFQDKSGVSFVLLNTQTGMEKLLTLNLDSTKVDYNDIIHYNPSLIKDGKIPPEESEFRNNYVSAGISALFTYVEKMKPGIFKRIFRKVQILLHHN